MFVCAEVSDGVCLSWVQLGLTFEEGLAIGGAFLGVSAIAWGAGFVARVILNR